MSVLSTVTPNNRRRQVYCPSQRIRSASSWELGEWRNNHELWEETEPTVRYKAGEDSELYTFVGSVDWGNGIPQSECGTTLEEAVYLYEEGISGDVSVEGNGAGASNRSELWFSTCQKAEENWYVLWKKKYRRHKNEAASKTYNTEEMCIVKLKRNNKSMKKIHRGEEKK